MYLACYSRPLCAGSRLKRAPCAGTFDVSDMHAWIGVLVNDLPQLTPGQDTGALYFQHALLGTQLTCRWGLGLRVQA